MTRRRIITMVMLVAFILSGTPSNAQAASKSWDVGPIKWQVDCHRESSNWAVFEVTVWNIDPVDLPLTVSANLIRKSTNQVMSGIERTISDRPWWGTLNEGGSWRLTSPIEDYRVWATVKIPGGFQWSMGIDCSVW